MQKWIIYMIQARCPSRGILMKHRLWTTFVKAIDNFFMRFERIVSKDKKSQFGSLQTAKHFSPPQLSYSRKWRKNAEIFSLGKERRSSVPQTYSCTSRTRSEAVTQYSGKRSSFFRRVWSWLRTNAGGVLNTCKSNGNLYFGKGESGKRVSNT